MASATPLQGENEDHMGYVAGFAAGIALILGPLVWGWLKQRPGLLADGSIRLMIVLAWLHVVVPPLLLLLTYGRVTSGKTPPTPPAGEAIAQATGLLFLLITCGLLVTSLNRKPARHIGWLAAALAPWAALQTSHILTGHTPGVMAAAYPAAALAIWLRSPGVQVLATIGAVTSASAFASLLLLVVRPDLALYASGDGLKTAWSSGLLAGIYPHANMLGMAMALGIPFVLLIQRPRVRLWCLVMTIGVLLATASRSSLAAAAAALALWLLVRRHPHRARQRTALPLLGAVAVMAWLPLTTEDPAAYTDRGLIWKRALTVWEDQPWLGYGPDAFTEVGRLANYIPGHHTHAHNLLAMTLVTGGLVMVAAMTVMLFVTWRRAVDLSRDGYGQPLIYLTVMIVVSWLEASLTVNNLAGYPFWLPLLVILLSRRSDSTVDDAAQGQASPPAQRPGMTIPGNRAGVFPA